MNEHEAISTMHYLSVLSVPLVLGLALARPMQDGTSPKHRHPLLPHRTRDIKLIHKTTQILPLVCLKIRSVTALSLKGAACSARIYKVWAR